LETRLQNSDDSNSLNEIRRISDMANIHFIRQKELRGLGDAIYHARLHTGNEPFAVLLGDTIINSVIPVTQQLIDVFNQYRHTILAVEEVPKEKVSRYGIIGGTKISDTIWEVSELVEKPEVEKSPSNLAIAGRYILTPEIYKAIEQTPPGKNGEIQLTDAMKIMLRRESIYCNIIEGKRYDIGNKLDYLKTTVEFALKRKEFAKPFREFLKEIVG
jgi:UTP--glucose-1-phosphate uridylyltransferase